MENATKALLIAAAILIAILIISLSLVVYNMAAEQVDNADLTEAEATAFNSKFTRFEGEKVSAASVKALLSTVLTNNQTTDRDITVTGVVSMDGNSYSIPTIEKGYYKVECYIEKGFVKQINVTKFVDSSVQEGSDYIIEALPGDYIIEAIPNEQTKETETILK